MNYEKIGWIVTAPIRLIGYILAAAAILILAALCVAIGICLASFYWIWSKNEWENAKENLWETFDVFFDIPWNDEV